MPFIDMVSVLAVQADLDSARAHIKKGFLSYVLPNKKNDKKNWNLSIYIYCIMLHVYMYATLEWHRLYNKHNYDFINGYIEAIT